MIKKLILAAAFTIAPYFAQAAELGLQSKCRDLQG